LKSRLKIKSCTSFKRQNYDLHYTIGLYFVPVMTLLALTGVAITFNRYVLLAIFVAGLTPPESLESILGRQSIYKEGNQPLTVEEVIEIGSKEIPDGVVRGISFPRDSVGVYQVSIIAPGPAVTGDFSIVSYDQYTGERVMSSHHDYAHLGKIYLNWVTPMHYGTFGGTITRILALLASLAGTVLFVTGIIIWWGRWKKRRRD
jgi:uncharacterized iron-regulated membrane protein